MERHRIGKIICAGVGVILFTVGGGAFASGGLGKLTESSRPTSQTNPLIEIMTNHKVDNDRLMIEGLAGMAFGTITLAPALRSGKRMH